MVSSLMVCSLKLGNAFQMLQDGSPITGLSFLLPATRRRELPYAFKCTKKYSRTGYCFISVKIEMENLNRKCCVPFLHNLRVCGKECLMSRLKAQAPFRMKKTPAMLYNGYIATFVQSSVSHYNRGRYMGPTEPVHLPVPLSKSRAGEGGIRSQGRFPGCAQTVKSRPQSTWRRSGEAVCRNYHN